MIIKRIYIILFLSLLSGNSFSQDAPKRPERPKVPFGERIFIRPDLGLQFGSVTIINVAPKVGYRITEKFAAGLGATYIYLSDKRFKSLGYIYETNVYGGSLFSQYQLFEQIQAYAEYELLSFDTYDSFSQTSRGELVPSLLVGGGYTVPLGERSSFVIMALYNLLDGPKSIYDNPVIRIGMNIGL